MWLLILSGLGLLGYLGYEAVSRGTGLIPAPHTVVGLVASDQSITSPLGTLIAIQAPSPGAVTSVTPVGQTSAASVVLSVKGGVGQIVVRSQQPAGQYDFSVAWKAPDGSVQTTLLHVIATAGAAPIAAIPQQAGGGAPAGAKPSGAALTQPASAAPAAGSADAQMLAFLSQMASAPLTPAQQQQALAQAVDPATGKPWSQLTEAQKLALLAQTKAAVGPAGMAAAQAVSQAFQEMAAAAAPGATTPTTPAAPGT